MAIRYLKNGKTETARAEDDAQVRKNVEEILASIEREGDAAVRALSEKFDNYSPPAFRLSASEIDALMAQVSDRDMEDLKFAQEQVRKFAQIQRDSMRDVEVETLPGVLLGHKNIPVQSVGCYVPGGKFPMVASAHMSVATASVAGVPRIVAATPPFNGAPNPAVIAAMHLGGAHEIYVLGGIQAVGAMALGTQTIDPVHMLVGPGNAYVAEAKRQVFGQVGIDMIAGPSEVLIVADETADPRWLALDLLAQAEHDADAQSILISDSAQLLDQVAAAVDAELAVLPRAETASASWRDHGGLILVSNLMTEAPSIVDRIAPEHLELAAADPDALAAKVRHAGAIFLGAHSPEAVGDYVGGPNHVLPTSGAARFSSGLGVLDFMKRTTILGCNPKSLAEIGPYAAILADTEGLDAHGLSVTARFSQK